MLLSRVSLSLVSKKTSTKTQLTNDFYMQDEAEILFSKFKNFQGSQPFLWKLFTTFPLFNGVAGVFKWKYSSAIQG